ncbi:hypothetical protein ZWY2020_045031 [Hordeum vulgare]|nr:hypothetical protein ZWY2020_045031 [Hordeum vulgare]
MLVQVHSARKHDVCVRKGYISSDDGRWFMDVFHVTDAAGCKVADTDKLLVRLESSPPSLAAAPHYRPPRRRSLLELIGVDRWGCSRRCSPCCHDCAASPWA